MPIDVFMTQLSPTMTEGKIARWLKKEGDTLESGEVLAEVETDKATMEMEVVDEGVLHKILAPEGSVVTVGTAIGVIAEDGEEVPADYMPAAAAEAPAAEAPVEPPAPAPAAAPQPAPAATAAALAPAPAPAPAPAGPAKKAGRINASPLARRLAKQKGINLAAITGTGPNGRIVKEDVDKALKGGIRLGGSG
ncbi:MAG TPA: E3 binding domain-containing protein, partial [Mariprofundaceae bacterium]|nr:E3 binding domain-containing protein [Mariprofundaceae bacterium]